MSHYVAIDIGGTWMRVAVYPEEGTTPLQISRTPTHSSDSPVIDRLVQQIDSLWSEEVAAICVAAPSMVDTRQGILRQTPNIPSWKNFPLRQILSDRFGVPVTLDNDANLAALAEWRLGAGRGHDHLLYLTISTGIGGGLISGGRLMTGTAGLAGEFGHIIIDPGGPPCSCGQRGHLEALASGSAISRYFAAQLTAGRPSCLSQTPTPTAREIAAAAQAGDALALEAIQRAAHYLGIGLANYLALFNPSAVILGGGVVRCGACLLDPVRASLERAVVNPAFLENLVLTTAKLGDDAGLLGALLVARAAALPVPSKPMI